VRQYLQELEQQNPVEEPVHEQDQVSTTDPDSTYATKGGFQHPLPIALVNRIVSVMPFLYSGTSASKARYGQVAGQGE
jgi:hypothetical protein